MSAKGTTAEIHIYEQIGESFWGGGISARRFLRDLKDLGPVTSITVRINSPGGNVFDGNAIYNLLKAHKATIHVIIDGVAASIASVIAMAGDTIEMPENAYMMIHNPSNMLYGTAEDMRKMADDLDKIKEGLVATYVARTGMKAEEISRLMNEETWMTAEDAMEMGFADKVNPPVKAAANFALLGLFKHAPNDLLQTSPDPSNVEIEETIPMATNPATPAAAPFNASSPEFQAALQTALAAALPEAVKAATAPAMAQIQEQRMSAVRDRFNNLSAKGNLLPAQAKLFSLVAEQLLTVDAQVKFSVEADGTNEITGTPVEALFALADTMNHGLLNEKLATESGSGAGAAPAAPAASAKGWTPDLTNVPENQAGSIGSYIMDQYIRNQLMAKNDKLTYAQAAQLAEKDPELRKLLQQHDNGYKA